MKKLILVVGIVLLTGCNMFFDTDGVDLDDPVVNNLNNQNNRNNTNNSNNSNNTNNTNNTNNSNNSNNVDDFTNCGICVCNSGCNFECQQECQITCASGQSCGVDLVTDSKLTCLGDTQCDSTCTDGPCDYDCTNRTSRCEIDCMNQDCMLDCGSERNPPQQGRCNLNNCDNLVQCSDGVFLCNRECPQE